MASASPLLKWLMSSGADVAGRLLLQIAGTAIFTRLLAPESFGLSALTMVYVALPSMFTTALFEEALTQRRVVRKAHFAAALAAVLLLAAGLYAAIVLSDHLLPSGTAPTRTVLALASVYGLILFADGPLSIYTAVARRHRRFGDIALGNLLGLTVGTGAGLVLAAAGAGVWSLLAVQPVARVGNLLAMVWRSPVSIVPRWARQPLRELVGFGGWHLAGRCVDGVTDTVFQTLVTRFFGLDGNGYLNMAMRVVEPIRGATGAIGHNIAMSYFARVQADPARLCAAVQQTIAATALLLQPVFIGLAVTAPLIILAVAGPGWEASGPVATALALAGAVASVSNFMHSGLSAAGRAELGFAASALELLLTAAAMVLLAPVGLVAAGLAKLVAWLLDTVYALITARRVFGLEAGRCLRPVLPVALSCAAMASAVLLVRSVDSALVVGLRLALEIATGALVYGALALRVHGAELRSIRERLRG